MKKFLPTIIEIAIWLAPMALGLMILLRSRESYEDSYNHSSAKGMGISLKKYINFFRAIAAILILAGTLLFYWFYLYESSNANPELSDFWKNMEKNKTEQIIPLE